MSIVTLHNRNRYSNIKTNSSFVGFFAGIPASCFKRFLLLGSKNGTWASHQSGRLSHSPFTKTNARYILSAIQVIYYIHTYRAKIRKTNDHQIVHMLSSDTSVRKANISSLEARQEVSPQVCTCSSHNMEVLSLYGTDCATKTAPTEACKRHCFRYRIYTATLRQSACLQSIVVHRSTSKAYFMSEICSNYQIIRH